MECVLFKEYFVVTTGIKLLIAGIVLFFFGLIIGSMWISYSNQEINLRNLIVAKQKDNQSQLDNTIKKISQSAQVSQEQMTLIKQIIIGNSSARHTNGGALVLAIREAVPNLSSTSQTFINLQNIIVAARDRWTMDQTELLDLNREHNNLLQMFPSSLFVGSRPKIHVTIVTSARTQKSFATGQDNNVNLFTK